MAINLKPPADYTTGNGLLPLWNEVVGQLEQLHGLIATDVDLIRTYCYHANMVRKLTAILAEKPFLFDKVNNPYPNPLKKDLKEHSRELRVYADALGLSIKARKQWKRAEANAMGKKKGASYEKLMDFVGKGKK